MFSQSLQPNPPSSRARARARASPSSRKKTTALHGENFLPIIFPEVACSVSPRRLGNFPPSSPAARPFLLSYAAASPRRRFLFRIETAPSHTDADSIRCGAGARSIPFLLHRRPASNHPPTRAPNPQSPPLLLFPDLEQVAGELGSVVYGSRFDSSPRKSRRRRRCHGKLLLSSPGPFLAD